MRKNRTTLQTDYDYKDIKTLIESIDETGFIFIISGVVPWDLDESDPFYSVFEERFLKKFVEKRKPDRLEETGEIKLLSFDFYDYIQDYIYVFLWILISILCLK